MFALTATAQAVPTPAEALQEFQRTEGAQWAVQMHAPTGTPRVLFGNGIPLPDWRENSLAEARRHAHLQLQQRHALLGLGHSEFRERIGARMGRTWTFHFDQWFAGLPVLGGSVDVRLHMLGKLVHLGSTAWPLAADFVTVPTIGETEAVALAWLGAGFVPNDVPQPGTTRTPRLVIHANADPLAVSPPTLAWEIPIRAIDAQGLGPLGSAYVDAKTGAFLRFVSEKHECGFGCGHTPPVAHAAGASKPLPLPVPTTCTVMGYLHTAFSPASTPTNIPLAGVEVVVPGHGTYVTNAAGQFTVDLVAPTAVTLVLNGVHSATVQGPGAPSVPTTLQPGVPVTLQFGSAASGEFELAHTTTYHWTWRINDWARTILGNTAELAQASQVSPTVNIASSCNAFYSGNSINFYAAGGGCNNTAGASVIAHEWGHGLDDRYGGISQNNGLSEGWGDICSMYLLDDPEIGHDFFLGGGGIRNGNNNQQYPNGSGVHAQGLSWMGFAWRFRQNLRAAFGTTQALLVSNDVVLGSIVANASSQADAVIAAFQADDNDGQLGNGTPHYAELAAACQAHSLPYPPIINGYLAHAQLTTTKQQWTSRRIEVDAIPFTGQFTEVRAHWLSGGVWQQRNLVPSGTPNRWHGLLPGIAAPSSLMYHIEAVHGLGSLHRLPLTNEYVAMTVAEQRIWFEDFETGGAGWTHGATTGVDDWEIGAPAGRFGFGWVDPGVAASGIACAGTDLGQSSDGAYSAASDSWLRSPPIDCTGFTGIRMRCKRWVSCAGPVDRVEIRVNGVAYWTTPTAVANDTGWSTLEFYLPTANNNPALVFEFRLISNGPVQYGGCHIDDVEVYTLAMPVALPAVLRWLPEQVQQGNPVTVTVSTGLALALPIVLALGDTGGPTLIPGIPTMLVGGNVAVLFASTDANGQFSSTFTAPPALPTGSWWYSQCLTLDANLALVTSNPSLSLFTQ